MKVSYVIEEQPTSNISLLIGNHFYVFGHGQEADIGFTNVRNCRRVVYAKRPFGAPEAVLAYARYTHRVAISNSRLIALHDNAVAFKWKDYRIEGRERYKTMTLAAGEFIRRFLMHVLPSGFHRIRHYGLFARRPHPEYHPRARIARRIRSAGPKQRHQ